MRLRCFVSLTCNFGILMSLLLHKDDAELFHGLPVGLQLIGRTQEEEAVIAMTEVVDKALQAYGQAARGR